MVDVGFFLVWTFERVVKQVLPAESWDVVGQYICKVTTVVGFYLLSAGAAGPITCWKLMQKNPSVHGFETLCIE